MHGNFSTSPVIPHSFSLNWCSPLNISCNNSLANPFCLSIVQQSEYYRARLIDFWYKTKIKLSDLIKICLFWGWRRISSIWNGMRRRKKRIFLDKCSNPWKKEKLLSPRSLRFRQELSTKTSKPYPYRNFNRESFIRKAAKTEGSFGKIREGSTIIKRTAISATHTKMDFWMPSTRPTSNTEMSKSPLTMSGWQSCSTSPNMLTTMHIN